MHGCGINSQQNKNKNKNKLHERKGNCSYFYERPNYMNDQEIGEIYEYRNLLRPSIQWTKNIH